MKRARRTVLKTCVSLLLLLGLCLIPLGAYSQLNSVSGEGENAAAAEPAAAQNPVSWEEPAAASAVSSASGSPAVRVVSSAGAAPEEPAAEEPAAEEPAAEEPAEDAAYAAAWTSPAPANFTVAYTVSSRTAYCSWNAVAPAPYRYRVYRWDQNDYGTVYYCYQQVVNYEPAAGPYFTSLSQKVDTMLNSPGLTAAERQAMLDAIEVDVDALNNIMCASTNTSVSNLLRQLKNSAYNTSTSSTNWSDPYRSDDTFYWYAVVTRDNRNNDTSPLSHSEAIFATTPDGTRPAPPTGVTAKAYDPGVFVEWSRNTETDLAGYNVYRVSGSSWTLLNTSGIIVFGTEYYFADGTAGQFFGVRAVDTSGNVSNNSATAAAALQPATIYLATDPGWSASTGWKVEYYTQLPPPDTGPADLLVAQDTGAQASHDFSGRRVKLYVSTYWSCGDAFVIIDGQVRATVSMSGGDSPTWGKHVFTISGLPKGSHTFALKCLGSGGSSGYNFVNIQYIEVR